MQGVATNPVILSASSLAAFAKCPTKFRLQYRERIRPAQDAVSLRFGSNLHDLFEHQLYATDDEIREYLTTKYADVPQTVDAADWEMERNTLLALFTSYRHHWADDPIAVQEREHSFNVALTDSLVVQGKIDAIGTWQGRNVVIERKTTNSSLDDGDYWGRLRHDVQVSLYVLYLAERGLRVPTLYDVIRKPTIRRGKKETPTDFFLRLLDDIAERPGHYYARREISRTDVDLDRFREQLGHMASAVRAYDEHDCWWPNYAACRDPYPCPYASICHGEGADSVIESGIVPLGFIKKAS